jgi:hypothetical protein
MRKHLAKLRNVKSRLDTKPPQHHTTLRVNAKREQTMDERYTAIERDNLLLLNKMHGIFREPDYAARTSIGPSSLNIRIRRNDLVRITRENHVSS